MTRSKADLDLNRVHWDEATRVHPRGDLYGVETFKAGGCRLHYADPEAMNTTATHNWQHSMGDIVNALIGAGMTIEWLHEFPFCPWRVVAGCEVARAR